MRARAANKCSIGHYLGFTRVSLPAPHCNNEAEKGVTSQAGAGNTICRRMPGCARLAEWCYGEGSNLIYNGDVFKQSTRGQQGCPLMMPAFCATKREMRDRIPEVGNLNFAADFADDGVDGGDCDAVYKVLERGDITGSGVRLKKQ